MDITPKYTEIVGINWFRSNFIEFKKVIDIGADKPAEPWRIPPPAPIINTSFFAFS